MAKKMRFAWAVLGGLVVGLLLVACCQDGAATGQGPAVVEREPAPVETAGAPEAVEEAAPAVEAETTQVVALVLKFVQGQTTTYKVTTETERNIKWEGNTARKPAQFRNGRTGHRIELTFDQQIERLTDEGHAVVAVTIKALRYLGRTHEKVVVDFDSARASDRESPLAKLIGQSYKIEMAPKGMVMAAIDVEPVRAAVGGNLPEHKTALKLVSDRAIRQRHEIPSLMALKAATVEPQSQWSSIKAFSFGLMGAKTYERIYTFAGLESRGERSVATVAMEAIPTVAGAGQSQQPQAATPLGTMFDNTDSYTGQLELDLQTGQIERYVEQFRTQWVTADPESIESGQANPAVLKMGAIERHQLERIE